MRRKWLGLRKTGGEGGILLPPFLLSACDPYTSEIIACFPEAYKNFHSWATVSIVSPIRCSSAENGISGISQRVAAVRDNPQRCSIRTRIAMRTA